MKLSSQEFQAWDKKSISLIGMSGVGKTRIASMLRKQHWFHYSSDYRIGTRYLDEPILDNIKYQLMAVAFFRGLIRSDSLNISNNITIDNLEPVSSFLGKLGDPDEGGLSLKEFKRRQELHRQSETAAMKDLPEFIYRANNIYGYDHVINDTGGSLCELDNCEVLDVLSEHSLIIYIEASENDEQELIERAEKSPKPLYYRESFLDEQLAIYMSEKDLEYVTLIQPDDLMRWLYPRLFYSRIPRYKAIAEEYGYTVSIEEASKVKDEKDFVQLISSVLAR